MEACGTKFIRPAVPTRVSIIYSLLSSDFRAEVVYRGISQKESLYSIDSPLKLFESRCFDDRVNAFH